MCKLSCGLRKGGWLGGTHTWWSDGGDSPYCCVKAMRADDSMDDRTSECTTVLPVMKSRFFAACTACARRYGEAAPPCMAWRTSVDGKGRTQETAGCSCSCLDRLHIMPVPDMKHLPRLGNGIRNWSCDFTFPQYPDNAELSQEMGDVVFMVMIAIAILRRKDIKDKLKHLSSRPGCRGSGVADAAVTGICLRGPPVPATLPMPLPPAVSDGRGAAVCMPGRPAGEDRHSPKFETNACR